MPDNIYCTYLTVYKGNKLPPFYIGSTTVDSIHKGYHGSVKSQEYTKIWNSELKEHPNLFSTKIISTHQTREESVQKELDLQRSLNVVKSSMYINMSLACKNGFIGCRTGRKHTEKTKQKISNSHIGISKPSTKKGTTLSDEYKQKISTSLTGRSLTEEHKLNISKAFTGEKHPLFGKKITEETRKKLSESHKGQVAWNKGKKYKQTKPSKNLGRKASEETKSKMSKSNKPNNPGRIKPGTIPWNKGLKGIKRKLDLIKDPA